MLVLRSLSHQARRAGAALAAAVAVAGCEGSLQPDAGSELRLGTWGGPNAGIIATDSVTHVHIGCTLGDVPGRVPLDPRGRFSVEGTYVLRAYPIMVGPRLPARFTGQVIGKRFTLSVAVDDTVEHKVVQLGPVTVAYGRDPELGPCPICLAPSYIRKR